MKKNYNLVIYILIAIIIVLLAWKFLLSDKVVEQELVFNINNENIDIKVGDNFFLDYEVSEGIDIEWVSANKDIVTVNNGVIKGIGLGNTIISGTVKNGNESITRNCYVKTYYGEKNNTLNDLIVPEGELFITKGTNYEIELEYNPVNAYMTSINYDVDDANIVEYDGVVHAKNIGTTSIRININNSVSKSIVVNVVDKTINPVFSKKVEEVKVNYDSLTLKPNESKNIEYNVLPENSFVESVEWESSDPSVVTVDDGLISAKKSGEATIKLLVNNKFTKEIKVAVSVPITNITLKSNSKIVLKTGYSETIKAEILPANASNKKLQYTSSNGCVSVSENGVVTAISAGTGTITIKSMDSDVSVNVSYVVNPRNGLVSGDGGIWGYKSDNDKIPVKATAEFFQQLASNGKGTYSGGTYTYITGNRTFKYNVNTSRLNIDGRNIMMRIYYPQGVDLSSVNTLTFFGGGGERDFGGMFTNIENDRSLISSSGIIILISARSSYDAKDGILATEFIKNIVDQQDGVKNTVAGYSMSGPAAGYAAENAMYSRLILFDSYVNNTNRDSLKNKEIIVYSPIGDALTSNTIATLNGIIKNNYNNITIVSNSGTFEKYKTNCLVINPGSQMGSGHVSKNITAARVFSYACS